MYFCLSGHAGHQLDTVDVVDPDVLPCMEMVDNTGEIGGRFAGHGGHQLDDLRVLLDTVSTSQTTLHSATQLFAGHGGHQLDTDWTPQMRVTSGFARFFSSVSSCPAV